MLELRDVTRVYRLGEVPVVALRGANLRVEPGEFVAVVGPSGSGKSTLLQILGCLDRPTSGEVILDGQPLERLSDAERTRLRLTQIGFVFQRFHLISTLTAAENVAMPMEALGVGPDERWRRARALLEQVGMGERLHFAPARLSGGQRQRVTIARAVANQPPVLLADEPTGALHSDDKAQVIGLFRRLN